MNNLENKKMSLNFSIDNIEVEDIKNDRFAKVIIYAMADGENAHTHPIATEVLKKSSQTVYDIPLVCKYDKFFDDFMGHEKDEVPIGFVKESSENYSNPIVFQERDGRVFLVIKGLIWKRYSGNAVEVFKKSGNKKSVSVEFLATAFEEVDGKPIIKEFVLQAITILGDFVNPAIKDANAQLIEFSKDKEIYLQSLEMADESIKINNTKEAAVSGKWVNPRRKLFNPIIEAKNKNALFKEAYLINENTDEDLEISKVKYPHHVIKDNELVIHIGGVEAAFKRASQQGIVEGKVKEHLLRHYKELGLNTNNFSEFNISEKEFELYFSDLSLEEEGVGGQKMSKEKLQEEKLQEEMSTEIKESKKEEMAKEETSKEEMQDSEKSEKMEEKKEEMSKEELQKQSKESDIYAEKKMEDDDDDDDDETEEEKGDKEDGKIEKDVEKDEEEMSCKKMSYEEIAEQLAKMADENQKLKDKNDAFMSKLEEMQDYEDLKKFKDDTLEAAKKEEEMSKMNEVMADIEKRGVDMTDEDKEKLLSKFSDFESIEAWTNFAKATIFDKAESFDGFVKIGFPSAESKDSGSLWDQYI